MKKLFFIYLFLIVNIFGSETLEASELACKIVANTILTNDNSPYLINCNIEVLPDIELKIEKGVEIIFEGYFQILISGNVQVNGTNSEPVKFTHNDKTSEWKNILIQNATSPCSFKNAIIENGNIYSQSSEIFMDSLTIILNCKESRYPMPLVFLDSSRASFMNSKITSNGARQGIYYNCSDSGICKNNIFNNVSDPIEFTKSKGGEIINNILYNSSDDCMDIDACSDIEIINNIIDVVKDKGISIGNENAGSCKNIIVKGNIISNCMTGIAVKDSSQSTIINNTLYKNKVSIHCYEKRSHQGGGFATIINNIFSDDSLSILLDNKSVVEVHYCLFEKEVYDGIGNFVAEPMFIDEFNNDFRLKVNSPCIDAGDPNSELDADGTRADIGAKYYNQSYPKIVINEINYNSSLETDSDDWIELFNNDSNDVDISGWEFKTIYENLSLKFPATTVIKKGNYLILCKSSNKFKSIYPNIDNFISNNNLSLNNSGEKICLIDSFNKMIDSVEYDNIKPWNELADGLGHSLELLNPDLDNNIAENWISSSYSGSPGMQNNNNSDVGQNIESQNNIIKIYPNPAVDYLYVECDIEISSFDMKISDIMSRNILSDCQRIHNDNSKSLFKITLKGLPEGFYSLIISTGSEYYFKSFFILK